MRHIAHITIEAKTPLKIGSNASDFIQDSPIQKDWNGLPMILGTSIAGVLRKEFDKNIADDIFGTDCERYKEDKKVFNECLKNLKGSRVIISNGLLLDENGEVKEELLLKKTDFLRIFDNLPIREHTAIDDKGVALEHSKFDEEVLYKGSRFKFAIELIDGDKTTFENILDILAQNSFRIGGGGTKGFGQIKIIEIEYDEFDSSNWDKYSSSLNTTLSKKYQLKQIDSSRYDSYKLILKPDDFFIFGSGFGDDEADSTPVYEKIIDYDKQGLSKKQILIPASSIKGAIAHRTTYHYNLKKELYAGDSEAMGLIVEIFGEKKDSKDGSGSKGKILINDCYLQKQPTKIFDHVAIDRFTGGAIDGALFQEKVSAYEDSFEIDILVEKEINDEVAVDALQESLKDICNGMLGLGGMNTKGHGFFTGELYRNGEKL